jgi:hypothetical protein
MPPGARPTHTLIDPDGESQPLDEFYKKGCQEKSSALTGGPRLFLEIQPTLFR